MRSAELHILQPVPPSVLVRDDNGTPKTAVYGGVTRHRVPSQSWKRAARLYLPESKRGIRTKSDTAGNVLAPRIKELVDTQLSTSEVTAWANPIIHAALSKDGKGDKKGVMLLFSQAQLDEFARLLAPHVGEKKFKLKAADMKEAMRKAASVPLAAFGRMVAFDKTLSVDAAVQVAHAISTHQAIVEDDFITTVDDFSVGNDESEDAGSGFLGNLEFTSSTLYRYASVSIDDLYNNLRLDRDPEDAKKYTVEAVRDVIESLALSMPSGKQTTFASHTRPAAIILVLRESGQPVSYAGAFEKPVQAKGNGYVEGSAQALVAHIQRERDVYGTDGEQTLVASASAETDSLTQVASDGQSHTFADLIQAAADFAAGIVEDNA